MPHHRWPALNLARPGARTAALLLVVAVTVGVSACASGEPASTPSPGRSVAAGAAGTSSQPPTSGPVTEIEVTIDDGTVTPPPDRVEVDKGATVRLTVTSDTADELHVHGFDKEAELEPGVPVTVEFVADADGVYEVETHESGLLLLQLVVR